MQPFFSFKDLAFLGAAGGFAAPDNANLVFWGDVNQLVNSDGDAISSYTDYSGNGNHATAATTARPTYKVNIVNSKPVLRFNGTANEMAWPDVLSAATSGTIIAVMASAADPASGGTVYCPWYLSKAGAGDAAHPFTTPGNIYESFGSDGQAAVIPKPTAATSFHVYSVTTSSNKMVMRWNGTIIGGQDKNSPGFSTTPKLGRNQGDTVRYAGDFAEILIYKSALTNAQLKSVNDYLAAKYSITVADVTSLAVPSTFSGLQGWWKADSISASDGDPVASWSDSSGNSQTLTGTTTTRPLWKASLYNSLPAVRWDGVDDKLILSSAMSLTDVTFIAVAASTTTNGVVFGHESSNYQTRTRRGAADQISFFPNGGSESTSKTTWNYSIGNLKMFAWTRKASTGAIVFYQDGVEVDTAGATNTGTYLFKALGFTSTIPFGGDIGEAFVYNTVLTQSDIARIYYDYLRDRWGLP